MKTTYQSAASIGISGEDLATAAAIIPNSEEESERRYI